MSTLGVLVMLALGAVILVRDVRVVQGDRVQRRRPLLAEVVLVMLIVVLVGQRILELLT